jgi:glyoxylase-like metal-dependent hydrolase (beta-lactamase superfamily II)
LNINIYPDDVRRVIFTHLHAGHAGRLHQVPRSEFLALTDDLPFLDPESGIRLAIGPTCELAGSRR